MDVENNRERERQMRLGIVFRTAADCRFIRAKMGHLAFYVGKSDNGSFLSLRLLGVNLSRMRLAYLEMERKD